MVSLLPNQPVPRIWRWIPTQRRSRLSPRRIGLAPTSHSDIPAAQSATRLLRPAPQDGTQLQDGARDWRRYRQRVSAALRAGCQSIDAVEIDLVILKLGQQLHPEHPYQSERVHAFVKDGRAFFHEALAAGKSYDLIVFGLVDSQAALSVVSSLRLEFLLYSLESFREARSLLEPKNGLLVVGFSVGWRQWVAQRLYNTLEAAFDQPLLALRSSDYVGVLNFVAGPGLPMARRRLPSITGTKDETRNIAGAKLAVSLLQPQRHSVRVFGLASIGNRLRLVFYSWCGER